MKCPSCGEGKLVRDTRDIPYTYKGEATTIPAAHGQFCPACGESVLAVAESKRVSEAMLEFNKQVNASIVDPGFIARPQEAGAGETAHGARPASPFAQRVPGRTIAGSPGGSRHSAKERHSGSRRAGHRQFCGNFGGVAGSDRVTLPRG